MFNDLFARISLISLQHNHTILRGFCQEQLYSFFELLYIFFLNFRFLYGKIPVDR